MYIQQTKKDSRDSLPLLPGIGETLSAIILSGDRPYEAIPPKGVRHDLAHFTI